MGGALVSFHEEITRSHGCFREIHIHPEDHDEVMVQWTA